MSTLVLSLLFGSSSFLQVTRTTIIPWMNLYFRQNRQLTVELASEKLMCYVVTSLMSSNYFKSSSVLKVNMRTAIESRMSSKIS